MKVVGNALNGYGKFTAFMSFLVALCACLISWSIGGTIIFGPKYKNVTTGNVQSISCSSNVCSGTVLVNGVSIQLDNMPKGTMNGQTIQVYYTNDTPPKYSGAPNPPKSLGVSLMSVGLMILAVAILIGFTVTKSRTASQVLGGVTLVDQISSAFR